MVETQETIETPHETISARKIPSWACDIIQEAEIYGALEGSKILRLHPNYVALMCKLVDEEHTCFVEASKKKGFMDAMMEEYQSILKNDVLEVVPRQKDKSMVSSKWIFKTKNSVDGSIGKFKEIFFVRGFSQKEGIDYEEIFAPVARYTSMKTIIALDSKMI